MRTNPVVITLLLLAAVFTAAAGCCSLPKIVVLHDPLSLDEHLRLGAIYESEGKPELAQEQYRAALRQNKKHAGAWTRLGDLSYRSGDFDAAAAAYRKVLDLAPDEADVMNNLAWVYGEQNKKLTTARKLAEQAMAVRPGRRAYYLDTLGVILLKLGKPVEALAALRESVATLPADDRAARAEALGHLADGFRATGVEQAAQDAARERDALLKSGDGERR